MVRTLKKPPDVDGTEVFSGLRNKWLGGDAVARAPRQLGSNDVIAVLMEFANKGNVVSFVAGQDGHASMYTSKGGGMIGLGFRTSTAAAAMTLVACAQAYLHDIQKVTKWPPPTDGNVAFWLITRAGNHGLQFREAAFQEGSPVAPLYEAGQHFVTSVRLRDEAVRRGPIGPQSIRVHIFQDGGVCASTSDNPIPTWLSHAQLKVALNVVKANHDRIELSIAPGRKQSQEPILEAIRRMGMAVAEVKPPSEMTYQCGGTTLHHAVAQARLDLVEDLLARGAAIEAPDDFGRTPLILASFLGRRSILRLLVQKGADVDACDSEGSSVLMFAAQFGDPRAVEALISSGANIHARSAKGLTALKVARLCEQTEVARMLKNRGATE